MDAPVFVYRSVSKDKDGARDCVCGGKVVSDLRCRLKENGGDDLRDKFRDKQGVGDLQGHLNRKKDERALQSLLGNLGGSGDDKIVKVTKESKGGSQGRGRWSRSWIVALEGKIIKMTTTPRTII